MAKIFDLIIIGGGPAGITAGIYGARERLATLLITKSFGGQMARKAVAIENYPGFEKISGSDLIQKFQKHLKGQNIEIEKDTVTKIKIKKVDKKFLVLTKGRRKFEGKAVIVASGADPRPLEVAGEKKYLGRGVSYCTVCDGSMFADKTVAVIGGGNAGFEAALFLAKIAKKIYIFERNPKVSANLTNQEKVRKTGKVEVITNALLKKIKGNQFVNSLIYQDSKTGKRVTLAIEGIFVEIGSIPATDFVKDLVDFNKKDEIIVNPKTAMTKTPGLFSAGDVDCVPYKQIVIACGEGAKASLSVYDYLQKQK